MKAIKAVAISVLFSILVLPCFAVFNESDNVAVNILGIAYSAIIFTVPKYSGQIKSLVRHWHRYIQSQVFNS